MSELSIGWPEATARDQPGARLGIGLLRARRRHLGVQVGELLVRQRNAAAAK